MSDIGKSALKNKINAKIYDNENQLITGSVLNEVLQDAVDTLADGGNLDAGSVDTSNLKDNAVTTGKITDGNVTTAKVADGAVTTAKIADANVTTAKIADNAIETTKIKDGNVTKAKIASAVTDDIDYAVAAQGLYQCTTEGATAAKEVTATGYELRGGGSIRIKFTNKNTASSPTLSINGSLPKQMMLGSTSVDATNTWNDGDIVEFVYYPLGNVFYGHLITLDKVSVSQNTPTGTNHTRISVGGNNYDVASVEDVDIIKQYYASVKFNTKLNSSYNEVYDENYYLTPYIPFGGGNFYLTAPNETSQKVVAYDTNFNRVNQWGLTDGVCNKTNVASNCAYLRFAYKNDIGGYLSVNGEKVWQNVTGFKNTYFAKYVDWFTTNANLNTLLEKLKSDGYIFGGIVSPTDSPVVASPTIKTFYLCKTTGTEAEIFTNFGNLSCVGGNIIKSIFYQGAFVSWGGESTGLATNAKSQEYASHEVSSNNNYLRNIIERATPTTNPDTTTIPKIYIADTDGTYTNFVAQGGGSIVISDNQCALLSKVFNQGAFDYWKKTVLNIATIDELQDYVTEALSGYSPSPEIIEAAVTNWLNEHPEATTTVEDGSIDTVKFVTALKRKIDDIVIGGESSYNNSNIIIGEGNVATQTGADKGSKNFVIGITNLNKATSAAQKNVAIGYHNQYRQVDGQGNVSIGTESLDNISHGSNNVAVGTDALRTQRYVQYGASVSPATEGETLTENVCVGAETMRIFYGHCNTAIGKGALRGQTMGTYGETDTAEHGSHNIAIGYLAGAHHNGDNAFYLDAIARGSLANEQTKSMMYGTFNDSPSLQMLALNVGIFKLPYLPTSNPNIAGQLWNDNGTLKISAGS